MKNWKIGTRITAGFAAVILITVILGVFAVDRVKTIGSQANDLATNYLPSSMALFTVKANTYHESADLLREAKSTDAQEIAKLEHETQDLKESSNSALQTYTSLPMGGEEARIFQSVKSKRERFLATFSAVQVLSRSTKPADNAKAIKAYDEQLVPELVDYVEGLQSLLDINSQGASSSAKSVINSVSSTVLAVWIGILVCIGLAIPITLYIVRGITKPLGQTVLVLEKVADGDLTEALDIDSKDEIGIMSASLNTALEKLRTTLQGVTESAERATASSHELASAAESIATGAQEQAASLEETSASLEEITATVRQSADNAKQASQLAIASGTSAERGQDVVASAVAAMGEINASSAKIADIISTIDEIAFQTNLLAVNAAVEAARAGDEGRGFAVVAAEVRSLAQRSAEAAKEIKGLIQDSLRKVEKGTELVNRSGETLHGIVTSVKRVTDIVGEMSLAAQEQSTGIEQVSTAMNQMDQVTQANSAHTEELSATAQCLSDQANDLMSLVSTFKVTAGNRAGSVLRSAKPVASSSFVSGKTEKRFTLPGKKHAKIRLDYRTRSVQLAKPGPDHEELASATTGKDHADFEEF